MRIPLIEPGDTDPHTGALLSGLFEAWGTDFNVLKGIANNGAVLEGLAAFLGGVYGGMNEKYREMTYLTTSVVNECFY